MDAQRINITICGDGGTGKSSITLRLVRSEWTEEYDPTIEDSYSVSRTIDSTPYLLSLTDTAGQEEYRSLQSSAAKHADAFLLVYDITAPSSLHEQLPYFVDMIAIEREASEDAGRVPPVCVVAGNKCDLADRRAVAEREGKEWARARGCGWMETSARESVGVEEAFEMLARKVVEARRLHAASKMKTPLNRGAGVGIGGSERLHVHGDSFSRTKPLTPLGERAVTWEDEDEEGAGEKSQAGVRPRWLEKMRCW